MQKLHIYIFLFLQNPSTAPCLYKKEKKRKKEKQKKKNKKNEKKKQIL
jgi:hypothetical protein